jgi:LysR family transcriptional regulator, hypochlorite-specific transcription factor HypT
MLCYSAESALERILHAVHGVALDRVPARKVFTAHLASALRTMAWDGRGVAWLPATLASEDITSGRLVAANSGDFRIHLEIRLHHDKSTLGAAGEKLWDAVSANT